MDDLEALAESSGHLEGPRIQAEDEGSRRPADTPFSLHSGPCAPPQLVPGSSVGGFTSISKVTLAGEHAASRLSSGRRSDDEEPDPSMSPPAAKRRKKGRKPAPSPLGLSEVPMNLPPIPSDRPGSASRFKGVSKSGKKWQAQIQIPSEGGDVYLGTFDSEEEAGIMYARARVKYPDARFQ